MTSRDLYEVALIELNKLEAPSLLLEDYNYFINKAIQQYINLVYAKSEMDQQSTDDIRVLKASSVLSPKKIIEHGDYTNLANGMFQSTYYVDLPTDYMHLLNCIVEYKLKTNFKCYNTNDLVFFSAKRLTSDMYSQIINNAYMRPMYKRPYYYLNNINTSSGLPTNSVQDDEIIDEGLAISKDATAAQITAYFTAKANLFNAKTVYEAADDANRAAALADYESKKQAYNVAAAAISKRSLIDSEKDQVNDRLANSSTVRLELRFGKDDGIFVPNNVYIDYLKAPMFIRLTQEQINSTLDTSQVLEFPDYVCFEIANIFVRLLMENASDPRIQTNVPINQTISSVAQATAASQASK